MSLPARLESACDTMWPGCPHAAGTEVLYSFYVAFTNFEIEGDLDLEIFYENERGEIGSCAIATLHMVPRNTQALLL